MKLPAIGEGKDEKLGNLPSMSQILSAADDEEIQKPANYYSSSAQREVPAYDPYAQRE